MNPSRVEVALARLGASPSVIAAASATLSSTDDLWSESVTVSNNGAVAPVSAWHGGGATWWVDLPAVGAEGIRVP